MFWQAHITLLDGTELTMLSGTKITSVLLESVMCAVFESEFDTIGVPLDQLQSFHIWEQGVTH